MPLVDYLVLTPLDEEWRSARKVFAPGRKDITQLPIGNITYYLWRQPLKHRIDEPGEYLVVAASMGRRTPGQSLAAAFSGNTIQAWAPARVVLIGIAGSLDPANLKLGDVVAADEVYGYEVADAVGRKVKYRQTFNRLPALHLDRIRAFKEDRVAYEKWQDSCVKASASHGLRRISRPPELHIVAVASGNEVVKSVTFGKDLQKSISTRIRAVEMEAEGLYQAIYQGTNRTDAIMLRGVSDYADTGKAKLEKKSKGNWRSFSAANAARLLKAIWQRRPTPPLSPGYRLDTTIGPRSLFRQNDVPRDFEFKGRGTQHLAFAALIARKQPTPALTLAVEARSESGAGESGYRGLCIVESDKRSPIRAYAKDNSGLSFELPPSEAGMKVELLLAFPKPVNEIRIACADQFQRSAMAIVRKP